MVQHSEKLLPLIIDSITEGVFTINESFKITSFNLAAEKITGFSKQEAMGKFCYEIFKASICQNGCALKKTMKTSEPQKEIKIDILNSKMNAVPIMISTAVLKNDDGKLLGGVEIFRDVSDVESLRSQLKRQHSFRDIIGQSNVMQELFALIPQAAESDAPVLVTGPSGTGKELVAQAIHDLSSRKSKSFVRVNCGALPDTLLESELFGYAKGAFTGAIKNKPGRFMQAHEGTLFLDEIGDVSPAFQVKLLRALEDGEIQPLGDIRSTTVNVRIICATNRNLEQLVRDGVFREDLYYRIRVVPIELPPLKERREDIPLLINHFVKILSARSGRLVPDIAKKALRALYNYNYPGNVRELKNILERGFVLCSHNLIETQCLPPEVIKQDNATRQPAAGSNDYSGKPSISKIAKAQVTQLESQRDLPEVRKLLNILEAYNWNRSLVAKSLNIGRTTLWRRMKEYGLIQ